MPYDKKRNVVTSIAFSVEKIRIQCSFFQSIHHVLEHIKTKQTKKAKTAHKERDNEALYNNMHINSQQRVMSIVWSAVTERTEVTLDNPRISINSAFALFQIMYHIQVTASSLLSISSLPPLSVHSLPVAYSRSGIFSSSLSADSSSAPSRSGKSSSPPMLPIISEKRS